MPVPPAQAAPCVLDLLGRANHRSYAEWKSVI
jgi:hypothetical protein